MIGPPLWQRRFREVRGETLLRLRGAASRYSAACQYVAVMSEAQKPFESPVVMQLVWAGVEEMPAVGSNVMLSQVDNTGEALFLSFGAATAPVIAASDDPAEIQAQIAQIGQVVARPVAKIMLTRTRVEELSKLLSRALGQMDASKRLHEGMAGDDERNL